MRPIGFRSLFRHLHHTVLFLLVWAVFLNGCSSWRTLEGPPTESNPQEVLVTLKDGSQITVRNAYASADTLFGYEHKEVGWGLERTRQKKTDAVAPPKIAIPLRDIALIEERYASPEKSAGAVVVGLLGAVVLLVVFIAVADVNVVD